MTTSELIRQLHNLSEIDVQDIGEDVNGNPIFAIKINNSVGSFIVGDMNIDDFPEWKNVS